MKKKPLVPVKSRIRAWVRALRSQKYTQTTSTLKRVNSWLDAKQKTSYCCLGVACEIYRDATKHGEWRTDGSTSQPQFVVNDDDVSHYKMPKTVAQYFGLKPDPIVTRDGCRNRLSVLNDEGVGFKEIATLIAQEFLK